MFVAKFLLFDALTFADGDNDLDVVMNGYRVACLGLDDYLLEELR